MPESLMNEELFQSFCGMVSFFQGIRQADLKYKKEEGEG